MRTRRPCHPDRAGAGATLIEILVVLGIIGLVMTTAYMVYVLTVRTERTSMTDTEVYDAARQALTVVAEQVRMAGLDPKGKGLFGFKDVTGFTAVARNDAVLFSCDVNGDGTLGAGGDERVGFMLLNGHLRRTTDGTNAASGFAPIARDVTAFTIAYFDASNNSITVPASATDRMKIRRVEFVVTVSKRAGAFGMRTITVRTNVRPRNL